MIDSKRQDTSNTKAIDAEMQSETLVHNNHTKEMNYTSSVSIKLCSDIDSSKTKQSIARLSRQSTHRAVLNPSSNILPSLCVSHFLCCSPPRPPTRPPSPDSKIEWTLTNLANDIEIKIGVAVNNKFGNNTTKPNLFSRSNRMI